MLKKLKNLFFILFACSLIEIGYCQAAAIEHEESSESCVICTDCIGANIAKKNEYLICGHEEQICKSCLQKIGICPLCRSLSYARLFFLSMERMNNLKSEYCTIIKEVYKSPKYENQKEPNFNFIIQAALGNIEQMLSGYSQKTVTNADISFAIMVASINNHIEVLKELIKLDNIEKDDLSFSLIMACARGNAQVVECLISYGADVNYIGKIGINALMMACNSPNSLDLIKLLLYHKANIHQKLNIGYEMLVAINNITFEIGQPIDSRAIIEYKAKNTFKTVGILPHLGRLNISFANFKEFNVDFQILLIRLLQLFRHIFDIDYKNCFSVNAIHNSVLTERIELVEFLLKNGAKIEPWTLCCAISTTNRPMIDFIVAQDDLDINESHEGLTPFLAALATSDEGLSSLLIEKRAEINPKNQFNGTPLHSVVTAGNTKMANFLIEKGVNIDVCDSKNPILLCAVMSGNLEMVQLLLKQNVNVNIANANGISPLNFAVANGLNDIAKELIRNGADVNYQDNEGDTALFIAVKRFNIEIVDFLIEYGADILHVNKNSKNIMDIAIENELYFLLETIDLAMQKKNRQLTELYDRSDSANLQREFWERIDV